MRPHRMRTAAAASAGVLLAASVAAAEPAFTGMQVQGNTEAIAETLGLSDPIGALVRDVAHGGPANLAGVERSDLIVEFNGEEVETFDDLLALVEKVEAGDEVGVVVLRNGQKVSLTMTTIAKPPAWSITAGAISVIPSVGLTLASLSERMRQRYRLRWSTTGVVVSAIERERLGSADLNEGDVIVKVGQRDVWDPEQVTRELADAKGAGRDSLLLLVENAEGFRLLMLPVR